MIRLAFLGVLALAGLLAFAGYSLVRNTGGTSVDDTTAAQAAPQATVEAVPDAEPEPTTTPIYFLADQDLDTGALVLVLGHAGEGGGSVIVTDVSALKAAQDSAHINADPTDGEIIGSIALGMLGLAPEQRLAALFRDDELVLEVRCGSTTCGPNAADEDVDYAGLIAASRPFERAEETFDSYDAYLNALSFIASDPDYALLGLKPSSGGTHPVPRDTPTATIALPTIYRSAEQPLNVDTHTALLSALVSDALPDGITLTGLTMTAHGPAIVTDADNGLPATRGGAEIPFPDVLFYTPEFTISGASDLPDDVMQSLTEDTTLRIDWDAAQDGFLTGLGLTCSDCFILRIKGDTYDAATVVSRDPERYQIAFYDLRDTP